MARASWWWEVGERFKDLKKYGLPDYPLFKNAILKDHSWIVESLEKVVRKPTAKERRLYAQFREEHRLVRKVHTRVPEFAKVLGISWPVSEELLKSTWRMLALQHHPDQGGTDADFIRMKNAYDEAIEVLAR